MAIKIGHASIDENGKISGGAAGDQNAREVRTQAWYNASWNLVLRCKDSALADKMAKACEQACANNKIGYDQYQRNTLLTQAKACGWDLSKITTACECDCSSLMAVCAQCAGIDIPYISGNAPYTGIMKNQFTKTGKFEALTDKKYFTSDAYLRRGDILVRTSGHTAMALEDGPNAYSAPAPVNTSYEFAIGDIVNFTGNKHFVNSNSSNGKNCKPGKAKVTAVARTGKHPVHLVAVTGGGSTVYGWVDTNFIERETANLAVGARVKVNAGAKTYTGGNLLSFVYKTTYDVISVDGDRVVIGIGKAVTAAINKKDLTVV